MDNLKEENAQNQKSAKKNTGSSASKIVNSLFSPPPASKSNQKQKKPVRQVKYIKPRKGNRIAVSLVFTFAILSVSVIASVGTIFLAREFLGIDKSAATYIVNVPEDATTDDVIKAMTVDQETKKKEPIIKVEKMFRLLVSLSEKRNEGSLDYVSGTHNLRPNMGYQDILEELQRDNYVEKETVRITFKEGTRLRDAAYMLEEEGVCDADKLVYYFNMGLDDYDFESLIPKSSANDLRFDRMEGYFFPDTYEFYKAPSDNFEDLEEADYEVILRKVYENFEAKYDEEIQKRASELGMSMDKVITLASIVQLEARDTADMKNVASVFNNRLANADMFPSLESDPTREYSEYLEELDDYSVNNRMLNAYNTYQSTGLPPGPICSPGIDAIRAVLWPNETNYYYFCANIETREVYYAETLEQHEENLYAAGIDPYDF